MSDDDLFASPRPERAQGAANAVPGAYDASSIEVLEGLWSRRRPRA